MWYNHYRKDGSKTMTRANSNPRQPRQVVVVRRPPRKKKSFRWWIVLGPAAVLLALWLAHHVRLGFTWHGVTNGLGLKHPELFSQLLGLGIVCVVVVIVVRLLRSDRGGSDREE